MIRTITILLLLAAALVTLAYPVFLDDKTTTVETRIECNGTVLDLAKTGECPAGTNPKTIRFEKVEDPGDPPYKIPQENLGIAGALGGVALLIYLLPYLTKFKLGAVEIDLASPATPV